MITFASLNIMGIFRNVRWLSLGTLATSIAIFFITQTGPVVVSASDHDGENSRETKVLVCHKDGKSGNYSKNEVSIHSVNDANGLKGHGDHEGDIWSPFTYDDTNYAGQGDYSNTDFGNCTKIVTPTPSPTASPSPTPSEFVFPSCTEKRGVPGDKAHYTTGLHQIVGGELLNGSDDVYTLENGNYLQCFCSANGNSGIQTNWLRTNTPIDGWYFVYGLQWNLGKYFYAAKNVDFNCSATSTPTPAPEDPKDVCPNIDGVQKNIPNGWFRLDAPSYECRQFQYGGPESSHKDNPGTPAIEGYGTGGQVLGASTLAPAGNFTENFYLSIMFLGATLTFLGAKNLKKSA